MVDMQREFYSGYYKHHGLKALFLQLPNGMVLVDAPTFILRGDARLYYSSGLHDILMDLELRGHGRNRVYGDSAFPNDRYSCRPHFYWHGMHPALRGENDAMASLRVVNEQGIGKGKVNFAFTDFPKNLKIFRQRVPQHFMVAALLGNLHTCFYEGVVTSTLRAETGDLAITAPSAPELEEYLAY